MRPWNCTKCDHLNNGDFCTRCGHLPTEDDIPTVPIANQAPDRFRVFTLGAVLFIALLAMIIIPAANCVWR